MNWKQVACGIGVIVMLAMLAIVGCYLHFSEFKGRTGITYHYLTNPMVQVQTKVVPIYVDTQFTDSEKLTIRIALQQWTDTLNGYMRLEVVDQFFNMEIDKIQEASKAGGYLILKIGIESPLLKDKAGERTLGFTDAIGGGILYLVMDNVQASELYGVMLHEVGHLLGARHTQGGLMYPNYGSNNFLCIDKMTVQGVGKYWGIDWEKMNYCIKQ